jgi:hypothetical protein
MGSFSIYHWLVILAVMLIPVAIAAVIVVVVKRVGKRSDT